jgi:hypothetical protein
MMLWFRLALVCWLLLCVLLSLTLPVGLNHPLQVVESGPWLNPARKCSADWPTASVVRSMEFDPARATPLASLVLDGAWTAGNTGPPGPETYGPPEPIGPRQVAGQAGNSNQRPRAPFLHENTGSNHQF